MGLIISISGLRGLVPQELTPEVACNYAASFGSYLCNGHSGQNVRVCIGRDTRPSSPMLASAAMAGLSSVGVEVIDLGVVTTPTVGLMVRHLRCEGGVVVTASHNGQQYNGIKLISKDGMALSRQAASDLQDRYQRKAISMVDGTSCGRICRNNQSDHVHISKVLGIVDPEEISARSFRVVLDSVNGAGGRPARRLLAALGCQVKLINYSPTGIFGRGPEPIEENLRALCQQVVSLGADIGLAQDPDGDRLAIVDAQGKCLGEEYTLALAARYVLSERPGPVAVNLSTSRMIEDIATRAGCRLIRTPVGEANVASAMLEYGCVIGGEGNGGVIDLRVGPIRDSLVAMALVLQLMARTGRTIRQLADEIGYYAMAKKRFSIRNIDLKEVIAQVRQAFDQAHHDLSDGLRSDMPDGWFHLRASNTEPVMRLVAEARNEEILRGYLAKIQAVLRGLGADLPA